ncbi:hypothetical protein H0H81_007915 [Sphagnurus paluster]|uniref:Uncharacterized protein n=1 Tax=Sphagnurus paluster TaxID=117069 RepID=A0A9P7G1E6_9AGAR|nr:hypothetical protein H0H81_007915 [Sphagnurus paluster]
MSSFFGLGKTRTFKPRKDVPEGTKQYQLRKYAEATLGSGNLRLAVQLPEGEDTNEWLAVHGASRPRACPRPPPSPRCRSRRFFQPPEYAVRYRDRVLHGARSAYEYLWDDPNSTKPKRPAKLPAPEYVDALMNWAQGLLDDEAVFPNKIGVPFPRNFRDTVRTIVRRLFRVYAHIYSNHFDQICALGIEAHLNTSYRHFFLFINEFDLVDKKELAPLDELNDAILAEDKGR